MTDPTEHRFVTDDSVVIVYRVWRGTLDALPIVLHHGFTGNVVRDWVEPGVVAALLAVGRTVVAPDARGHGASGKPHRPDAYGEARMARDLSGMIDDLGAEQIDLVGFSMGAIVSLLAAATDSRVRRLVTVGVGASVAELGGVDSGVLPPRALADALLAADPSTIENELAATFVAGLDGDADRVALALHVQAARQAPVPLDRIAAPTLVLAGEDDPFARRPEVLAASIPGARCMTIAGDHGSAITNPAFAAAVTEFFAP